VHVVALDAFVHDAEAAADHGLAIASYIVGKSKTRSEVQPRIVHTPFRNSAYVADANSIQIELLTCQNRVRAGPKSRAESANGLIARIEYGRIRGVIQVRVEVGHLVVGFVGVRNAIPAQSEIQSQPAVYAVVVLN